MVSRLWVTDSTPAKIVCETLHLPHTIGIADSLVVSGIDSMRFLRATVILGADIEQLEAFSD